VTLGEAVATALERGPRARVARADSAAAAARVRTARQFPDPALALDYTKDPPTRHVELEQPLEYPWVRRARTQGAEAEALAASLRTEVERARIRYDVTVAYAEAAVARGILAVSLQSVADGEELVRVAGVRRDVGDASDLDVDLATVNSAQLRSTLLADSMALVTASLRLQAEMGLPVDSFLVIPEDSVDVSLPPAADTRLEVSAAEAEQSAAAARLREQRRARLPAPSVRIGFEQGDPDGDDGPLPTAGVSFTLPFVSRNRGQIAEAVATADRADAALALARTQAQLAVEQSARTRALAITRLEQDRAAVAAASQVARRSLTAYGEGAYPLSSVLEAQRSARDAVRQYLEDLAALETAAATVALARVAGLLP
jgi:cobalt-zinc-cadmium efflux system outer membrane protein